MSETPGQVLQRLLYRTFQERLGDPRWDEMADWVKREYDGVAAAFLAEVDTVTLLKAAKARVGHAPGEWGDE